MADGQDRSLAELCSICHINEPRYKCPRCSTRTCSLPCSKRHKLWSQCSGVRDPAAYLKLKDLASPQAFDKDFNFLSGIERRLERADREAENRGLDLEAPDENKDKDKNGKRKRRSGFAKGELSLSRAIEGSGVDVVRAPGGMTRSKQNMSHWHKKHKCLNWTVEWVFPDREKLITKCLETVDIGTAFSRTPFAKEQGLVNPPAKRRKIGPDAATVEPPVETTKDQIDQQKPLDRPQLIRRASSETVVPESPAPPPPSTTEPPNPVDTNPQFHIYLHRPQTRSKVPVLIPLPESKSLADCLRGRKVLEFPTLYILSDPVNKSTTTTDYILEEDYLDQYGAEEMTLDALGGDNLEEGANHVDHEGDRLDRIDESKILEVLNKDLGQVGES